ncbi:hypothetical protein KUTeg_015798 [Tegillarca granosa]|uniref:cystathionine gamma-lyase n=1 Tax=Tegillarca granosa TaxID=220873 RepID=A0ABQ9EJ06_TEGGR|nr:hypothetical protein KUTeg_015798 [Tegillarca granosa]
MQQLTRRKYCKHTEMDGFQPFPHFGTDATHAGQEPEQWKSRAVVPPISMATTFKQSGPAQHAGFEYSRSGNPTRNCLEKCIAALEGAKHAVTHLLQNGDHIVSMNDVYGGTNRYFQHCATRMGIKTDFVDCTDTRELTKGIKPTTKLVWIETPSNPTMQLVDIEEVCRVVRAKNPKIIIVVDNTFMSSYFQRFENTPCKNEGTHEEWPCSCQVLREASTCNESLPSHPQHELAKRQMRGYSGMVTFLIKGGLDESTKFLQNLKIFTLAESLGGFENL